MQHTIQNIEKPLTYLDDKGNLISLNGYAFIDKYGHCIIIVYGESRMNFMSNYLNSDNDELGMNYN